MVIKYYETIFTFRMNMATIKTPKDSLPQLNKQGPQNVV